MKRKFKGAGSVLPYLEREKKVLLRNNGEIEQYVVTKGRNWLAERDKDGNIIKGGILIEDPYRIVRKIEAETEY